MAPRPPTAGSFHRADPHPHSRALAAPHPPKVAKRVAPNGTMVTLRALACLAYRAPHPVSITLIVLKTISRSSQGEKYLM
jgi:hypothetical protein